MATNKSDTTKSDPHKMGDKYETKPELKGTPTDGDIVPALTPITSDAPLVIKTNEILKDQPGAGAGQRPGVIPSQPAQEGIDPATNRPVGLVDPETLQPIPPLATTVSGLAPAGESKHKGKTMNLTLTKGYWPKEKPDNWSDEDKANRSYRLQRGQQVELPEEEALTLLDRHAARRTDPRS